MIAGRWSLVSFLSHRVTLLTHPKWMMQLHVWFQNQAKLSIDSWANCNSSLWMWWVHSQFCMNSWKERAAPRWILLHLGSLHQHWQNIIILCALKSVQHFYTQMTPVFYSIQEVEICKDSGPNKETMQYIINTWQFPPFQVLNISVCLEVFGSPE